MLQALSLSPPIHQQAVFRVLLTALTHPGDICRLPAASPSTETEMIKAVSRTLLDHEVTFALAGKPHPLFSAEDILRWTQSRNVPAAEADFLFITGPDGHADIARLQRGSAQMPDTGATVIFLLSLSARNKAEHADLTVSGPGISPPGHRRLPSMALSKEEIHAIQEANGEFPMGIDCFFLDLEGTIMGLPRSVTLQRRV
jgi:alpha-D-ribose 1-methylphosphonate 5-triphosphate synthase subunit PhnH